MTTTATRLDAETMISLYQRYAGPLLMAREGRRELFARYGRQLRPKLDDIEAWPRRSTARAATR